MSNIINCVIDTYSFKERKELIDYISSKVPFVSLISHDEGFHLFCIQDGIGGYIGTHVAKHLVEKEKYFHFYHVEDFIKHCEYFNSNNQKG